MRYAESMSEPTAPHSVNRSSQSLAWILSLLSLLLLGIVTAAAIRHNPLYSDHDTYGVSTYRFIENCKEELQRPSEIKVGPLTPGQPDTRKSLTDYLKSNPQQPLPAAADVFIRLTGTPSTLVEGVQHPDATSTQLRIPATVGYRLDGAEHLMGQAPVTCNYNPQTHRAEILLQ